MKSYFKFFEKVKNQAGVTVVIIAIVLTMLIGFTALAVDVGYRHVTKNELQNVADAAALAATRKLGTIYLGMTEEEQQAYFCGDNDIADIKGVAEDVASKNKAGKKPISVYNVDNGIDEVEIGVWELSTFTTTYNQPDAVRVTARRDGVANGPITTFFAKIDTVNVCADATAALTGQSTAGPGGLPLPMGISRHWFDHYEETGYCNQDIKFYPTGDLDGCAGWHTYEDHADAHTLEEIIEGLTNGTYESPETQAGETEFNFVGGNLASILPDMKVLFDAMKVLNDGILDLDEDSTTWTTSVAVYDLDDCSNPNKTLTILGFATVVITEVLAPPDGQLIQAKVICEMTAAGRGGGSNYGTKGSIPGLVE